MKTREEFVEELATVMCEEFGTEACEEYCGSNVCANRFIAEKLYDAGYRKQSDTVREFVGKISQFASAVQLLESRVYEEESRLVKAVYAMGKIDATRDMMKEIKKLAKEYGVEEEK